MNQSFITAITPPPSFSAPAYWFIFRGFRLLVFRDEQGARIPWVQDPAELGLTIVRQQYMGYCTDPDEGYHAFVAEVGDDLVAPEGMAFQGIRPLFGQVEESLVWLAGRAVQLAEWNRASQYCGHCGVPTQHQQHERAKICPECERVIYPRLSPAIIVLVEKIIESGENKVLLGRSHRYPPGLYSVLAGFVEPGETLETAVQREIREEVGITVKNIRYFGSQPWPFPNSLMIAYTAEYAAGEIVLEPEEMADAQWFTVAEMPHIPPSISIARRLIDWFVAKNQA